MICPNCNKEEMVTYTQTDINTYKEKQMLKCHRCGHFILVEEGKITDSDLFTLEFSCTSGDSSKFIGTQEEIRKQIDTYEWTGYNEFPKEIQYRNIATNIEFLKYGFMNEFLKDNYKPYEFTFDNCFWIKIKYGIN
jgi:transcription elongation factor Elf1